MKDRKKVAMLMVAAISEVLPSIVEEVMRTIETKYDLIPKEVVVAKELPPLTSGIYHTTGGFTVKLSGIYFGYYRNLETAEEVLSAAKHQIASKYYNTYVPLKSVNNGSDSDLKHGEKFYLFKEKSGGQCVLKRSHHKDYILLSESECLEYCADRYAIFPPAPVREPTTFDQDIDVTTVNPFSFLE